MALLAALCLLADAAVAYADYLGKRWVLGEGANYLVAAFLLCNVSLAAWFVFLRLHGDLGRAAVIWSTTGVVAALAIGTGVFKEPLTLGSKIGVGLSIAGVVLMGLQK